MDNLEAIRYGMSWSEGSFAGLADGHPICIFGCAINDVLAEEGQIWLFATDQLHRHRHAFLRRNKAYIEYLK